MRVGGYLIDATYTTKREAETARVELLSALQNGAYAPSKVTVAEWLDVWLAGRTNLADTTKAQYGYDVARVTRALGSHRLRDLTTAMLDGFYAGMTARGCLRPRSETRTRSSENRSTTRYVRV